MNQQKVLQKLFLISLHSGLFDILEQLQMDSRDFLHFDLLGATLFLSFLSFFPKFPISPTREQIW